MGDKLNKANSRGIAETSVWTAWCKDCAAEDRNRRPVEGTEGERKLKGRSNSKGRSGDTSTSFGYSDDWTHRLLERGNSRSDRCERHRRAHRAAIQALSVAYIELETIGVVSDSNNPTGPLGGLGPLPTTHRREAHSVPLAKFQMGMDDENIRELLAGLARKRVAIVEAGTGTGKSTLMPFRLMNPPPDAALRLNDLGPIIVTEPRQAAATGVARFVGESMCFGHDPKTCCAHIGPGFPVGYQVSGDRNWDSACQLIYVTDGTMINWVREGRLASVSTVIVDEAHERSENIDIILAQLRDQVARYQHLRVIVTSATMDRDFFIEFFGGNEAVHYQHIAAQKSFGYGVPLFIGTEISDSVIESGLCVEGPDGLPVLRFDGWAEVGPTIEGQALESLRETTRRLRDLRREGTIPIKDWKKDMPFALAEQVVKIAVGTDFGDILAFLPTTNSIKVAVEKINEVLREKGLDFDVYPLLSTISADIRDKAIEARSRGDKRKIVVSSNLAETSLTVKGVRYVVDSGLICQSEWDPSIASGAFPTKPHSQSGVRQRWGRVGRDAPGWVFPLYSLEQFLELPKNTPPGSTQTNLETFYMKLLAAGLDLDKVVLPANFVHPRVQYDEDSWRNIETFNQESGRARRALGASGAIDTDGHLTDFGREIERFSGSGAEAMAVMLADQLACVHEVALALTVLKEGNLIGHDKRAIFRIAREWPNAWRVHAAQCHRALVIGCRDDLDILIRIFSEWQAQPDPESWCANWWINHEALTDTASAVDDLIATLSAAMKSHVERPVRTELANRARAVLTRAMGSFRYNRVDSNRYQSTTASDSEMLELSRARLINLGDQIIVLSSFRPPPDRASGQARNPFISSAIRAINWVDADAAGSNEMGFELILQAAKKLRDPNGELSIPEDPLSWVRNHYPVGVSILIEVDKEKSFGIFAVKDIKRIADQFPYPGDPDTSDYENIERGNSENKTKLKYSNPSGFDPEWNPYKNSNPQTPDDEAAQALIDVFTLETNDELPASSSDAKELVEAHGLTLRIKGQSLPKQVSIKSENLIICPYDVIRAIVLGYELDEDGTCVLLIDALMEQHHRDPSQHPDLSYGSSIQVVVKGIVHDHEHDFVQIARADNKGYFYLECNTRGIDANDRAFAHRLIQGATFDALVIPGWQHDPLSISLLPTAFKHISEAPAEQHETRQQARRFLPATIIEEPNQWGKFLVELDYRDQNKGLTHRFEVKLDQIREWNNIDTKFGQKLLVSLRNDRSHRRRSLPARSKKCFDLIERQQSQLQVIEGQIRPTDKILHHSTLNALLGLEPGKAWERDVWLFYTDSFHLCVSEVRPVTRRMQIQVSKEISLFIGARKNCIESHHRVLIQVETDEDTIQVVGTDSEAIEAAREKIQNLAIGKEIWAIVINVAFPPESSAEAYGVFVMTPYGKALLHISNITTGRFPADKLESVFPSGSPLLVNIQSFEEKRLSVGLMEIKRPDGRAIFGRFAEYADSVSTFLSYPSRNDWSQLETWGSAFGIKEPGIWAVVSGLDLTTADKPGPYTALRLIEYLSSVDIALRLRDTVFRLESIMETIAPESLAVALSSTFPEFIKEVSRSMSRATMEHWLNSLNSGIENAIGVLGEKLNQIERIQTEHQKVVLDIQDALSCLRKSITVNTNAITASTTEQSTTVSKSHTDPQLFKITPADVIPAVPYSQKPPASPISQTAIIKITGAHNFQRTYPNSVILDRQRLSGAASKSIIKQLFYATGLKLHVIDEELEVCMLPNCPHCELDGVPLVAGVPRKVSASTHCLKLADIIELDIDIIFSTLA